MQASACAGELGAASSDMPAQSVSRGPASVQALGGAQNMRRKELRALAASLGVATRNNKKSVAALRAACCRALKGQGGIAAFFQPAGAPGATGRDAGVAPVSDSASALDSNPAKPHGRPRAVRRPRPSSRPMWLRKPEWLSAQTAKQKAVGRRRTEAYNRKQRVSNVIREKRPDRKEAAAKRAKKRYRMDFTERASRKARVQKSRKEAPRANRKSVIPKSARAERAGVLGRQGSWKRTAEESARLCQQDGPGHLPPCYAGLDQEHQRALTSQMCGCLEDVQWATCVVCWRAWYDLPAEYEWRAEREL